MLKKTEDEWNKIVGRIGRSKLKKDLASYKAAMPKAAVSGVTPGATPAYTTHRTGQRPSGAVLLR